MLGVIFFPEVADYDSLAGAGMYKLAVLEVDEMVGVWIPLLAVPDNDKWIWYVVAAFVLFRAFDIAKPLGIRKMESLRGGVGVMMDDILAGVYSFILLAGVRCVIGLRTTSC